MYSSSSFTHIGLYVAAKCLQFRFAVERLLVRILVAKPILLCFEVFRFLRVNTWLIPKSAMIFSF
jgi:hypothetical protein